MSSIVNRVLLQLRDELRDQAVRSLVLLGVISLLVREPAPELTLEEELAADCESVHPGEPHVPTDVPEES